MTARRTRAHFSIDGKLDEAAWSQAVPFSQFVESFPNAGAAPDLKTEARVLFDDDYLYVGVVCTDPHPELIARQLGRRDATPSADQIELDLDSSGDRRTAYSFSVNAAGVLRDQLLFADVNSTDTWDAVWDAAAHVTDDGWTAEFAIPLRALRFSSLGQEWGIFIRRTVPRTHQLIDSTLMPRNVNPVSSTGVLVSRFGALEGMDGLRPKRDVELVPYSALRGTVRPQYTDPARPTPRLLDPSLDVGLDFKIALTSDLSLAGAVNPDFGQVEADQIILNLSNSEAYYPEKRPLFTQGMDIFQPVGAEYGSPQTMFYSRRIGLDAPILTAAKLTGTLFNHLDIGIFDGLTEGASNPSLSPAAYENDAAALAGLEAHPDRSWHFNLAEPFHLGPNDAFPGIRPQTTNFLAAVARERFAFDSSVGLVFTAASPLRAPCGRDDFPSESDYEAFRCRGQGANALALDWNLKDHSGDWRFFGQVDGSQQVGGDPAGRTLADGTLLKPGDLGLGGYMRAGKLGGDPFRFDVVYVYEDRKLDLNAVGYQPLSNYQWADLNLHYVRPSGFGRFHSFSIDYNLDLNWSADGRWLPRGVNSNVQATLQLPSYDSIGLKLFLEQPQFDTREISGSGVPFERLGDVGILLNLNTDPNRRLFLSGDIFGYRLFSKGVQSGRYGLGWDATLTFRPTDPLETRIDASYGHKPQGARWIETGPDNTAVFGVQDPSFLSVTLRQQVVLTSRLTVQVYAQLFSKAVRYGPFFGASIEGRQDLPADALSPTAYAQNPNFHAAALNLNAVLRWEYRLGSTLFFVYSRAQSERFQADGNATTSVWPSHLFQGPAVDTFLVKWSYWWNV